MKNIAQKIIKLSLKAFVILITTLTVIPFYLVNINATLQDDLIAIQKRLQDIRNQKTAIQNDINNQKNISSQYDAEISKLKLQIDLLDAQVQEKNLVIQELDLQINLLNQNILIIESEISTSENTITTLEEETDDRMVDLYINEKTESQLNVFFSAQGTDFIKYSVYQNSVQQETNAMVTELNSKKADLLKKKTELEDSRLLVVASQTQISEEKLALTKSQSEYDQKRALFIQKRNAALKTANQYSAYYKNMTDQEKRAEEEQEAILRVIMARTEAGSGVYVRKGTFIGAEGTTGYSTGKHLHFGVMVGGNIWTDTRNPCDYLPYNIYPGNGDDNCDHKGNGSMGAPMVPTGRLTSGYKPWYRPSHLGIDIASGAANANIVAAHDGYVYYGYDSGGWGIYAKVCATRYCSSGIRTIYAHMKCNAEPSTSWMSCNK
jgi:peptidoglycan hydrolase CwlO-like protein